MEKYKLEVNETYQKNGKFLLLYLVLVWAVVAFVYYLDKGPGSICFVVAAPAVTLLMFIFYIYNRKIVYEVLENKIIKKRGSKTLRSVEIADVKGFITKLPIRLKVSGQKDFVFECIGVKSSREKLISVLRDIGLSEISPLPKFTPMQLTILVGAIFCAFHFFASILVWIGGSISQFIFNWVDVDWLMLLHSIPAFFLFFTSVLSIWLVIKRKRKAGLILLLTIVLSVSCGVFEISNHLYQGFEKNDYFTWWWYGLYEPKIETSSSVKNAYKYGYIDKSGQMVIEPQFDTTGSFSESMASFGVRYEVTDPNKLPKSPWSEIFYTLGNNPWKYSYKYGYIDKTGNILVEPVFDDASDFSEGLARIRIDGKDGYINKEGQIVIKPKFDDCRSFSEGLAVFQVGRKCGYIDISGKIVIEPQFSRAYSFSEGLAKVQVDGKYGYINKAGQIVIKPNLDGADHFSEGLAAIRVGNKYGYIDKTGQIVIKPKFGNAHDFSEGLAAILVYKWKYIGKWGYINKSGQMVIEPQFYIATVFREGFASVCYAEGWGYRYKSKWQCIDKDGMAVNKPYLAYIRNYSDGLAMIHVEGKYGYIDKTGRMVIEPQFESADSFFEGLAEIGVSVKENE